MKLPRLKHPELYQGLYVFDFGDYVAVGYTAEEIDTLLSLAQFQGGQAYKIHSATPDGQVALRGVSKLDISAREAIIFFRKDLQQARADFDRLKELAWLKAPPTALDWALASDPSQSTPHFTILLYSAEYTDSVGYWLQDIGFEGGDTIEGGSRVVDYYSGSDANQHEHLSIAADSRYHSRSKEAIMGSTTNRIQRELAYP